MATFLHDQNLTLCSGVECVCAQEQGCGPKKPAKVYQKWAVSDKIFLARNRNAIYGKDFRFFLLDTPAAKMVISQYVLSAIGQEQAEWAAGLAFDLDIYI